MIQRQVIISPRNSISWLDILLTLFVTIIAIAMGGTR